MSQNVDLWSPDSSHGLTKSLIYFHRHIFTQVPDDSPDHGANGPQAAHTSGGGNYERCVTASLLRRVPSNPFTVYHHLLYMLKPQVGRTRNLCGQAGSTRPLGFRTGSGAWEPTLGKLYIGPEPDFDLDDPTSNSVLQSIVTRKLHLFLGCARVGTNSARYWKFGRGHCVEVCKATGRYSQITIGEHDYGCVSKV